ncbi:MAG: hypothetical protein ACYCZ2_12140 [Lutibacter sp.]
MNTKVILFIGVSVFFASCSEQVEKVINININTNEKCYYFIDNKIDTITFHRNLIIVENTLNDTVIIGQSILAPKQIGKFEYSKLGNKNDISLNIDYDNPPTNRICVYPFKGKKSFGKIKLKLNPVSK